MLSAILKKESCAKCRFCCSFRRQSLWETPVFTRENVEAIRKNPKLDASVLLPVSERVWGSASEDFEDFVKDYYIYDLKNDYQTDNPEEEAKCPYLGPAGCILSDEEKPWDCKIWPIRVMRLEDGKVVIALTPTCPEINEIELTEVKSFVNENLREDLLLYAQNHPFLIKEYREGFPVLWCDNSSLPDFDPHMDIT